MGMVPKKATYRSSLPSTIFIITSLVVLLTMLVWPLTAQVKANSGGYESFEALGADVQSIRFGTEAPRGAVFTAREFFTDQTDNIYYYLHVQFANQLDDLQTFTLQAVFYQPDGSVMATQTAHHYQVQPGTKEVFTYNYLAKGGEPWVHGEYRVELLVEGKKVGSGSFLISPVINSLGNSSGNLNNKGLAASQGDWIYFVSNEGHLHRIRYNGRDMSRLTRDYASFINVQGEWVYYLNNSKGDIISRVRIDGHWMSGQSTETVLSHDRADSLTLYGDWLYYINYSDEGKIYKIKTDGTEKTKLSDLSAHHFTIFENKIYFIKDNKEKKKSKNNKKQEDTREAGPIFQLAIQGGESKQLTEEKAEGLVAANGWLYYMHTEDKDSLYKIKTDGSLKEKVVDERVINFYADNEWVYYQKNVNRGRVFYKLNINTYETTEIETRVTSKEVLRDGRMVWQFPKVYMNIVHDWLYYSADELYSNQYRMKTVQRSGGEKIEGIYDWDWRR